MPHAKHFTVVVNPRGGTRRGPAILEQVKPIFDASGASLDVHISARAGHAAELARTLNLDGCDGFCVVGGDGTIHEAVGGLLRRDDGASVPLGVLPGGTGNSMLAHLQASDPQEAARRILSGSTQPLDVVRVTQGSDVTYCVNIIGWGAAVDINRMAERLRRLGPPRYAVAAIAQILRARKRRARLVLDDEVLDERFLMVVACNTKFTGAGMQLAPDAEIGDGQLDVIFVRRASRWQMLKLFNSVFDGSHLSLPCVEFRRVSSFRIEPERVDALNLDGEIKGRTPLSGEVMPAALRIFG
jgi:sphingosine kinase